MSAKRLIPPTPEDAAQAGEYALGLMPEDERAAFEARVQAEPLLMGEVQAWHERLAAMTEGVDVFPRARVKRRLERRLFGAANEGRAVRLWQGLTAGAVALSAVLAVWLWSLWPAPAPDPVQLPEGPIYAAEIAAEDDSLRLLAVVEDGTLRLSRLTGEAREGRTLELWLIAGEAAPVSLGVLPDDPGARLAVDDSLRPLLAGGVLAVSDEPPGGSPTGAPTGDVLAVGQIAEL